MTGCLFWQKWSPFNRFQSPALGLGGGPHRAGVGGARWGSGLSSVGGGTERGAGGQHESGAEDQREILVAPTPACLSRGAGGHSLRKAQDWGSSPARVPSCVRRHVSGHSAACPR